MNRPCWIDVNSWISVKSASSQNATYKEQEACMVPACFHSQLKNNWKYKTWKTSKIVLEKSLKQFLYNQELEPPQCCFRNHKRSLAQQAPRWSLMHECVSHAVRGTFSSVSKYIKAHTKCSYFPRQRDTVQSPVPKNAGLLDDFQRDRLKKK